MKIHKLIEPGHIFLGLEAADAPSAMAAVAELRAPEIGLEPRRVVAGLLEREVLGSTSVGNGFAIPHCKLQGQRGIAVAVARFDRGVPFGGNGHPPVQLLFIVLSAPDQPAAHLQVLSQIARLLKRPELRAELLAAADPQSLAEVIHRTAAAEGL